MRVFRSAICGFAAFTLVVGRVCSGEAIEEAEFVFPLNGQHNHAPGIAELENGDLIVSWYRGSGERKADDVMVLGSRKKKGTSEWSEPFVMADTPGFPDCNTAMMTDAKGRLMLVWPVIIANTWESAVTRVRLSDSPIGDGCPRWNQDDMILLKPDDFSQEAVPILEQLLKTFGGQLTDNQKQAVNTAKAKLSDKLYQRLGWQPRCKPVMLPSGRILLPLYTDTFSISIMAISDDSGKSWFASKPILGFGAIQPTVLQRRDGSIVAYMRENGYTGRIRISESSDDGLTWSPVVSSELPNPGSGLDGVRLQNGNWVLVYNDTKEGRNRLAVSLSADDGMTWRSTRHLEDQPSGSFHYPCVIQAKDKSIHIVYSYFCEQGKTMKHVRFNEDWIHQVGE